MTSTINHSVHRATAVTSTRLIDGRELLYFDDGGRPAPGRAAVDRRTLPGRGPSGEIRYDALSGEWVAVAAHRQNRTHLPPADECPLCPSSGVRLSEIRRRITMLPSLKTGSRPLERTRRRPRAPRDGETAGSPGAAAKSSRSPLSTPERSPLSVRAGSAP